MNVGIEVLFTSALGLQPPWVVEDVKLDTAKRRIDFEVGCQGGIGRTGTVIACWAILDGVAATEAVDWVRAHYLARAVETPVQEWWVEWFGAHLDGRTPPPRPRT